MESKRRNHKNNLYIKKKSLETSIKRDLDTISRLKKNTNTSDDYATKRIKNIREKLDTKKEELENIEEDIKKVDRGLLDDMINTTIQKGQIEVEKKILQTKKQKEFKKQEKNKDKAISKEYWKDVISSSRAISKQRRDIRYGYKQYWKSIDTMPQYMRKNLFEMPNNKGYIWRGCHFYGYLKPQYNQPHIMFEKCRGGILRIHETTERDKKIYEKVGKNRKVLVSHVYRKKK